MKEFMKRKPTNTKHQSFLGQIYLLSKPGIVYGNLLAASAGYFLARPGFSLVSFITLLLGLGLVLASAGFANNIMDLKIDKLMTRTEKRPLVTGRVPLWLAYLLATVSLLAGILLLSVGGQSPLAAALGFAGWFGYLFIYGYAKRTTHHSTLIGAFPGALPPLIGYVYVIGLVDVTGILLYIMMLCWQMPHFYGISIFRKDEYANAKVPLLSITHGVKRVLLEMRLYVVTYTIACLLLVLKAELHPVAALVLLVSALFWSGMVARTIEKGTEVKWSRKVFGTSLLVLLLWPVVFGLNFVL